MSIADEIRKYVFDEHVAPRLRSGGPEIVVRAGDIHRELGFENRFASVCAALGANKFCDQYGLELVRREGPYNGANAVFFFRSVKGGRASENERRPLARVKRTKRRVEIGLPPPAAPTTDSDTIFLVSCVSGKRNDPAPARDLYTSTWFQKARAFVERTGRPWFILSAAFGLVHPEALIPPYDKTLNTMPVAERRAWAARVINDLERALPASPNIVIIAGQRYREFLMDYLRVRAGSVQVPLEGLRIGEQLSWLTSQNG